MNDTRMISGKWVEGLFNKALGPAISSELSRRLADEGLHLDKPLAHSYPRAQFVRWLQLSAADLYPETAAGDALNRLGARVVQELQSGGGVKGPVLVMARMMGPRRTLRQLADFVQGHSSLKLVLTERSSREVQLDLNEGELVEFVAGAMVQVLTALGARAPKASTQVFSVDKSVIALSWG